MSKAGGAVEREHGIIPRRHADNDGVGRGLVGDGIKDCYSWGFLFRITTTTFQLVSVFDCSFNA